MWYRNSGVVKLYSFNGSTKSLNEHLREIFPLANSVDIFYMVSRVRARAKSRSESVSDVLYDVVVNNIFSDHEDKR